MKYIYLLLVFLSFLGCNKNRVLSEQLIDKGIGLSSLMYYENKLFNGISFDVYPNGQLKFENTYKNGKENGLQKDWYENGQLKYESNKKDGKPYGKQRGWYENGQLEFEQIFIIYKGKTVVDGIERYWYENGQWSREYRYEESKLNGMQGGWYENGQLKFERNYKNGVLKK